MNRENVCMRITSERLHQIRSFLLFFSCLLLGTGIREYALGRIYTVYPRNDECFYFRLLLVNVHGPTSFQLLRNVDGELCTTYREVCQRVHWDR